VFKAASRTPWRSSKRNALAGSPLLLSPVGLASSGLHGGALEILTTEARVTLIDAALAGAVLIGIGLNALFGWWWADPLAGLVIVCYGLTEGRAVCKQAAGSAALR
jgi:hypothetical protein